MRRQVHRQEQLMAHQWHERTAINKERPVLGRDHKAKGHTMNSITIAHIVFAICWNSLAVAWMVRNYFVSR